MPDALFMKYFVLKPKGADAHAHASRAAMYSYADALNEEDDDQAQLAQELRAWASREVVEAEHGPPPTRETGDDDG